MCTLHSFPHNIDHCLTFARAEFEGLLEKAPAEANAFLLSPEQYLNGIQQGGSRLCQQGVAWSALPQSALRQKGVA